MYQKQPKPIFPFVNFHFPTMKSGSRGEGGSMRGLPLPLLRTSVVRDSPGRALIPGDGSPTAAAPCRRTVPCGAARQRGTAVKRHPHAPRTAATQSGTAITSTSLAFPPPTRRTPAAPPTPSLAALLTQTRAGVPRRSLGAPPTPSFGDCPSTPAAPPPDWTTWSRAGTRSGWIAAAGAPPEADNG